LVLDRECKSSVEPMYMKKSGIKNPNPKDESLWVNSSLCLKKVDIKTPAINALYLFHHYLHKALKRF